MNADFRQTVAALTALLTITLVSLATDCFALKPESRLPSELIDFSSIGTTELSWRNGEKLPGAPASAENDLFNWQSPLFTEPIPLPYSAVNRVDFATNSESPAPQGAFRFVFADGSHLTAELKSFNADSISLSSPSFGDLVVKQDQVITIERISGTGIIAAGPGSLLNHAPDRDNSIERKPAYLGASGHVTFLEFNGRAQQPIALPQNCLVSVQLRIEDAPAFSITLNNNRQAVIVETWDDELVLTNREKFTSAGAISVAEDGRINLSISWNQESGECVLFDKTGKSIAKLNVKEEEPEPKAAAARPKRSILGRLLGFRVANDDPFGGVAPSEPEIETGKGITLINTGAGFVVERYSVTEASAPVSKEIPNTTAGVETATEFILGTPIASDGSVVTVQTPQGPREIPLESVRSLRWAHQPMIGPQLPQTQLWYSDGNHVRGTLLAIADGKAQFQTNFANAPLFASLKGSRALVFPILETISDAEKDKDAELDTIAADKLILHGTIQPTGGTLPSFIPTGSLKPLTPVAKDNLKIKRHLSKDRSYKRAAALLITKNRESLPVTVDHFDAEKINFLWDATKVTEIPSSQIHAVQFPEPILKMEEGFESKGWRFIGKKPTPAQSKDDEKKVILEPGTSIGHPYLLHGADFGFNFTMVNQQPSFRIRLFCQGTDLSSNSINFLVAHYGSQVYAGTEDGQDGQFNSSETLEVSNLRDPLRIEFKFNGDSVEMWISGMMMGRANLNSAQGAKIGSGLVIEPTAIWGNSFGSVALSDFSISDSSVGVSAPVFGEEAKREALLLPRTRRDVPPRHVLIGRNGDLLRGEIEGKSEKEVAFRVGLEQYQVPIERIGAAVWVEAADPAMEAVEKKPAPVKKTKRTSKSGQATPPGKILESYSTQWLDLTNGGRLKLEVEAWNSELVVGTHSILGRCSIPTTLVHRITLTEPPNSTGSLMLSNWKFEHTIDPNPPGQDEADVSPLVGQPAPDYSFTMLEGKDFKNADGKGKVVVLDFWATWCGPCVRSLPEVITTMAQFPADKVAFIAVNQGEGKPQVEQFMEIRDFKMPVGFDLDMKIGKSFGVESIPYTVVIDPGGTVTYVSLGASPDGAKKLADAVNKALNASTTE